MKFIIVLTFLGNAFAAEYVVRNGVLLPDQKATPGVIRTTDEKEICAPTFRTGPFRKTTESTKKKVCAEYGVKHCPDEGVMEIDHLIPLELGGLDDIKNLWVQPAKPEPGFHQKDLLENYLHKEVCAGHIKLTDAQHMLRTDWYAAYKKYLEVK